MVRVDTKEIDDGPVPPPKEDKMKRRSRRSVVIRMLQNANVVLHQAALQPPRRRLKDAGRPLLGC
jgi:hypothetical protein